MKRDELLELIPDDTCAVLLEPEGMDSALIGYDEQGDRFVYSHKRLVAYFVEDGMTEEEALEWIDYNVIRGIAYMGDNAPIVITEFVDPEEVS
jgi:hypothetical protein